MQYKLDSITESFLNELKIFGKFQENEIKFAFPPLGKFLAERFNEGKPFTYITARSAEFQLSCSIFLEFEKKYKVVGKNYSFNELKFFFNVTFLDENTELYPKRLKEITLPFNWTKVPDYFFAVGHYGFNRIEMIHFPPKILEFGKECFKGNKKWKQSYFPETITKLGVGAFQDSKVWGSQPAFPQLEEIPVNCFSRCGIEADNNSRPRFPTFGRPLIKICDSAFSSSDFEFLWIPETVREVGDFAFSNCRNLETLKWRFSSLKILGKRAFAECPKLRKILLGEAEIAAIPDGCFYNCATLKTVVLPEKNLTRIGKMAFYNCRSITRLSFPESVREIGPNALTGLSSLESISLHSEVNIDKENFMNVTGTRYDDHFSGYYLCIPEKYKEFYEGTDIVRYAGHVAYTEFFEPMKGLDRPRYFHTKNAKYTHFNPYKH